MGTTFLPASNPFDRPGMAKDQERDTEIMAKGGDEAELNSRGEV